MADTDITPILAPLPVDQSIKADAWDQFHGASSPEDFQARIGKLNIPKEAKAALWDAKYPPAAAASAAPAPPALTGPSSDPKTPGAPNLPSAQEAADAAHLNAKQYVAAITNPQLGQLPGMPKPQIPGLNAPQTPGPISKFLADQGVKVTGPDGSDALLSRTPDGLYHPDEAVRRLLYYSDPNIPRGEGPRIDFSQALPTEEELKNAGASTASKTAIEAIRGLTDVASSMTTPENVGLMAGASAAQNAAKFAGGLTKLGYQVGSGGMALVFGTQAGKQVIDSVPDLKEAFAKKDWPTAARIVSSDVGQAALAGMAAKHIGETFSSGSSIIERGIQEHNAGAEEALVGDMAKGQAQPDPEGLGGDAPTPGPAKGPAAPLPKGDVREATFERVADEPKPPEASLKSDQTGADGGEKTTPPAPTRDLQIHPDSPFHGNDPHEVLKASVEEIGAQRQKLQGLQAKVDSGDTSDRTRQDLQYAKDDYEGMHHELEQHFGKEVAGIARTAIEAPDEAPPVQAAAEPTDEEAAKEAPVESRPKTADEEAPSDKLYHGGPELITKVDPSRLQSRDAGLFGKGLYVSDNEAHARYFGPKVTKFALPPGARVLEASLNAQDAPPDLVSKVTRFMDESGREPFDPNDRQSWTNAVDKYGEANGYDAIKYHPNEIVVKNSEKLAPSVDHLTALGKAAVAKLPDNPNVRAPNESEIQEAAEIVAKEHPDAQEQEQPAAGSASGEDDSSSARSEPAGSSGGQVRESEAPTGTSSEESEPEAAGAKGLFDEPERAVANERIAPGTVADVPIGDIHVDAPRFQFKQNVGQGGAGDELRGVTKFDPEKSGILSVWQDPKDGKTYVVNGHHRVELAQRTGAKSLTVRYLDAKTAKEARTKGALINIAEGRGESTDAAKVFRDSGMDEKTLAAEGVSKTGAKAKEGLSLSKLSNSLFDRVVSGEIPAARGAVIGEGLKSHADQDALFAQLEKREAGGKRATNDQVEEMIRLANHGPKVVTESAQGGLFGDEQVEHSAIFERAEVSDYIRKQLAGEKRLFSTVGTAAVEKTLGRTGNVIKSGDNAEVAQQAGRSIALYDKLSTHAGPVADAIDQGAKELASGKERPDAVKNRVYEAVRAGLIAQGDLLSGKGEVPAQRLEGNAQSRTDPARPGLGDLARQVEPSLQERTKTALKNKDVTALRKIAAEKLAAKKAKLGKPPSAGSTTDVPSSSVARSGETTTSSDGGSSVSPPAGRTTDVPGTQSAGRQTPPPGSGAPDASMPSPGKEVKKEAPAETGPHGPIFREFHHDAPGAIEKLLAAKTGEAPGALWHPQVPGRDIDLTYGQAGETHAKGYGLAKIEKWHHDVLGDLQGHLLRMEVDPEKSTENSIQLRNGPYHAVVRRNWKGDPKTWLLTQYKAPESDSPSAGRTIDVPGTRGTERQTPPSGGEPTSVPLSTGKRLSVSGGPVSRAGETTSSPGSGAPDASMPSRGKEVNSPLKKLLKDESGTHHFGGKPKAPPPATPLGVLGKGVRAKLDKNKALRDFLGDESGTSKLGDIFKADLAEMAALKAKRDAATEQLKQIKDDPASAKSANALAEAYMANRDLWSARVNQIMDRLRKMVPNPVDQEALSILRDSTHRLPGELESWLDGTHPMLKDLEPDDRAAAEKNIERLKPAIERAQNPTPKMLAANEVLTQIAAASSQEAVNRGMIDKGIDPERYFTHLLHPKGEGEVPATLAERIGRKMGGKIGLKYAFSEHRSYPTVLHAIADNVKPKTLNAFDAFTIHGDKFATARATHLLLDHLQDSNMGVWDTMKGGDDVPENWVKLAPHANEFHKEIPIKDEDGKEQITNKSLWVHPAVAKAMKPITDPNYLHSVMGFTAMRAQQALLKQANLSLSLFHARALNIMALGNMGPVGWKRGLQADRESPDFERAERDMIMHGGTSPIQGKNAEAYKSLSPGSIPSWGDVWRHAPVLAEVDKGAQAISRLTFDNLQRKFKVTDYQVHSTGWMVDHPTATAQEIHNAKTSIAKQVNAVYGGLNWERLGVNHASVEVARAIVLAPDWTFSNIFNVKYALEGGFKAAGHEAADAVGLRKAVPPAWEGPPAGKLARAFWIRTILGGMAATQLLSLMFTGKRSKKLTQVYMGKDAKGKEIYQNMFFAGAPQDATTLVNNIEDYGAVIGLARTMKNKAAPGLAPAMGAMQNEDFLGRSIVKKGMHPVASTALGGMYAAKSLAPIPYSVQNVAEMLIGPGSKDFKWWEAPATLFSGSAPRHEKPQRTKTLHSTWEEIKTGKL